MAGGLWVDQGGWFGIRPGGSVISQEVDARLAAGPRVDRPIRRACRDLRARLARVVDDIDPLVCRVGLIRCGSDLGVSAEEGVARLASRSEVAAIAGVTAGFLAEGCVGCAASWNGRWSRDVTRVVGREGLDDLGRAEGRAAVGRFRDIDSVGLTVLAGELSEGHVDVAVGGHRDVRELHVLGHRGQAVGLGPGHAVVGRAREVDVVRPVPGEARPGEVDVAIARATGPVGFDGGLVVEDAEEERGG